MDDEHIAVFLSFDILERIAELIRSLYPKMTLCVPCSRHFGSHFYATL